MPKFLERALEKEGVKHGFSGKRLKKYIFGGMNRVGAMHGDQETEKGKEMEAKHEAKMRPHPFRRVLAK